MWELNEACDLSIGTIDSILSRNLHKKKLAERWMPYLLNKDLKKQRVVCSDKLFDEFKQNGPKRLCDIVARDES